MPELPHRWQPWQHPRIAARTEGWLVELRARGYASATAAAGLQHKKRLRVSSREGLINWHATAWNTQQPRLHHPTSFFSHYSAGGTDQRCKAEVQVGRLTQALFRVRQDCLGDDPQHRHDDACTAAGQAAAVAERSQAGHRVPWSKVAQPSVPTSRRHAECQPNERCSK